MTDPEINLATGKHWTPGEHHQAGLQWLAGAEVDVEAPTAAAMAAIAQAHFAASLLGLVVNVVNKSVRQAKPDD